MEFHYFLEDGFSSDQLKDLFETLDKHSYESVLLPFGVMIGDMLVKIPSIANDKHKLKYMFAMRPYALHPSYLAMISKSYYNMFGNRLIFNIVNGKHNVPLFDQTTSIEDRKINTEKFLKRFNEVYETHFFDKETKPIIILSGSKPDTVKMASEHADFSLILLKDFIEYKGQFDIIKQNNKKQMVGMYIIPGNTEEEAKSLFDSIHDLHKESAIYGTYDSLSRQIDDFTTDGIDAIMVLNSALFNKNINADDFVLKYMGVKSEK